MMAKPLDKLGKGLMTIVYKITSFPFRTKLSKILLILLSEISWHQSISQCSGLWTDVDCEDSGIDSERVKYL